MGGGGGGRGGGEEIIPIINSYDKTTVISPLPKAPYILEYNVSVYNQCII